MQTFCWCTHAHILQLAVNMLIVFIHKGELHQPPRSRTTINYPLRYQTLWIRMLTGIILWIFEYVSQVDKYEYLYNNTGWLNSLVFTLVKRCWSINVVFNLMKVPEKISWIIIYYTPGKDAVLKVKADITLLFHDKISRLLGPNQ